MDKILIAIILVIVVFVLKIAFMIIGWQLFMVPVFHLAELSINQAIGLLLLSETLLKFSIPKED